MSLSKSASEDDPRERDPLHALLAVPVGDDGGVLRATVVHLPDQQGSMNSCEAHRRKGHETRLHPATQQSAAEV